MMRLPAEELEIRKSRYRSVETLRDLENGEHGTATVLTSNDCSTEGTGATKKSF